MSEWLSQLTEVARLMVGVKDYDKYVASRRRFSPNAPVMSREDFFAHCQSERYGGKSMKKCPC